MSKGSMRTEMPTVAAWIDDMRSAFGATAVDSAIRRGMRGQQGFFAGENGHTVGTPVRQGVRVGINAATGRSYLLDGPIAGDVVESKTKFKGEKK